MLLDDGRLVVLATHNRYQSDAVQEDVEFHWYVSDDGGNTWRLERGGASALGIGARTFSRNGAPVPAVELPEGTLITTGSVGWENHEDSARSALEAQGYYIFDDSQGNAEGVLSISHRFWMARSRDGGSTWETRDVDLPRRMPHLAQYGERRVLRDGTFIVPAWGRFDLKREPKYVSSLVVRTTDAGESWDVATVAQADDFDFNETAIAEAPNGDLVAVMRTTQQRELWTAVSTDAGRMWSEPRNSGMRGSTPWP